MRILPVEPDFSQGFTHNNDIFGRKKLYEQITNVIKHSLDQNLVLALNDRWGNGKTAFVKMLQGELQNSNEDINVIYFDAFKNDYQSDPLLSMISYVYELVDKEDKKLSDKILDTGKAVAVNLSKQLPKKALSIITANVISEKNIESLVQAAIGSISDPWEKYIEEKIKNSKVEESTIDKFRNILRELYETKGKKTLFIIDEMDRAKPDFVLELLEKIKHIFNVDGFYFLLVMNKPQFEESIKMRYGNIDSNTYLNKFIHYWFELPKVDIKNTKMTMYNLNDEVSNSTVGKYLYHIDKNKIFSGSDIIFIILSKLLFVNGKSLREAQRCYSLMSVIKNADDIKGFRSSVHKATFALVVYLKVNNQDLLYKIMNKLTDVENIIKELNLTRNDINSNQVFINGLERSLFYHFLVDEDFKNGLMQQKYKDVLGDFWFEGDSKEPILENMVLSVENMEIYI
ncbi:P-loop NTPase fold protein [Providencia vermicola]|uniref:KAP family P-loop NTPase fold protein n=1 Tax=Providencia vermicola TaxID=333965 RepID=UPI0032D9FCE4